MDTKGNTTQRGLERNIERVSQGAHQAIDRAASAASTAAERIGERAEALAEKRDELLELPGDWIEGARDYVREHPLASLGIALAAGYVLSMLMRSK